MERVNTSFWIINNLGQVELSEEIFRRSQVWVEGYISTCLLRTNASITWREPHDFRDDKEAQINMIYLASIFSIVEDNIQNGR